MLEFGTPVVLKIKTIGSLESAGVPESQNHELYYSLYLYLYLWLEVLIKFLYLYLCLYNTKSDQKSPRAIQYYQGIFQGPRGRGP